jgi:cytochrome c551/c552
VRRFALFALLAVFLAGCGTTVPGGGRKVTTPTPATVVGTIPSQTGPPGNATRGKAIFTANGCGACHTFAPAGSTGKVGPNLADLEASAKKANQGSLAQYVLSSIVNPNAYIVPGYPANVMPAIFGQKLSKQQLADLVAFLTQKS